jgi:hypothetical protein
MQKKKKARRKTTKGVIEKKPLGFEKEKKNQKSRKKSSGSPI